LASRELCDVRDELGRSAEREAALQRKLAGKDVEIGMAAGEAENSAMKTVSDSIKALTQARDRAEAAQVKNPESCSPMHPKPQTQTPKP
jgi:hypothetical protein